MKTTKTLMSASALFLAVLSGCHKQSIAQTPLPSHGPVAPVAAATTDFDFLAGTWQVLNRRLVERHVGSTQWDEFPGRSTMRAILGGLGNVDEIRFPTKGWSGATMRFFSPERRQWSIYWVNSRDGLMRDPVVGGFQDGIGTFFGDDMDGDRAVRVRFIWSRITSDSARWEQAFSTDEGKTWETNWVMDFARLR